MSNTETCQRCESPRIATIGAKCSDCCGYSVGTKEGNGYVPGDLGIGGGDYVEFSHCLNCGQIQGKFPLPPSALEIPGEISAEPCEFCGSLEDVAFEIDPYASDLYGDKTLHHICNECADRRADEL